MKKAKSRPHPRTARPPEDRTQGNAETRLEGRNRPVPHLSRHLRRLHLRVRLFDRERCLRKRPRRP
ncbi:MAG: hypothetical protein MZU97_12725 [Bacillus subtilis]|nr:hypothetical protein [Bacillus subtilis]